MFRNSGSVVQKMFRILAFSVKNKLILSDTLENFKKSSQKNDRWRLWVDQFVNGDIFVEKLELIQIEVKR